MALTFTSLENTNTSFFHDIFHASLYVPAGEPPIPKNDIKNPELRRYYQYWGQDDDLGFILEEDGVPVGAIWSRKFATEEPGYGFIDEETPEFGIAIIKGRRGERMGEKLLLHLFDALRERGDKQVSLSVHGDNHAAQWYQRLGFRTHSFNGKTLKMVMDL